MYSIGIYLYALIVRLVAAFGHRKARAMVRGQHDTWRILREKINPNERYIWFHAASLGEFEQGLPLIERLRREQPARKILLTFFSPSGYEVRKDYKGADVVCYLPFDSPTAARRFIKLARPEMAFFIKYEFWRNYIDVLFKKSIPIYSVSSIFRPGQIFFRWYGRKYARCLRRITHFFVQNERSVKLLRSIGVTDNVTIVGDTRFDRVIDIRNIAKSLPIVEQFSQAQDGAPQPFVLVAGSSWQPDEDILLDYVNHHPEIRLVIAPHVVNEAHIQEIEQKLTTPALRYSKATPQNVQNYRVLIIDGYGLLSSIYRYATVAYVGGGFGVGIHNVPEAAVYGIPVIIGPNHQRFAEAVALMENGGCKSIENAEDFTAIMDDFLENPSHITAAGSAAGHYINQNAGATPVIYQYVFAQTLTQPKN